MIRKLLLRIRLVAFIFFCLIYFRGHSGLAQYSQWQSFSTAQGLGDVEVYTIFESPTTGDLWFGTRNGATRYDGTWRNFDLNDENSAGNRVHAIGQDNFDCIWFGTEQGIKILQNNETIKSVPSIANEPIWAIKKANGDSIWVGTSNGAYCFDQYEKSGGPYFKYHKISSIVIDTSQTVWFGTNENLIYSLKTDGAVDSFDLNAPVNDLFMDMQKRLWVATEGAYAYFFDGISFKQKKIFANLSAIEQDWYGNFWFATQENGVIYDDSSGVDPITFNYLTSGLSNDFTLDILEDGYRNIWIATRFAGVSRYDGSWRKFKLMDKEIKAIEKDDNGNIWFGTNEAGAFKYNQNKFEQYYNIFDAASKNKVTAIEKDHDSFVWFGTLGGGITLFDFDKNEHKIYKHSNCQIASDNIFSIFKDTNEYLWIGTFESGVSRFCLKDSSWESFNMTNSNLAHNTVRAIYENQNNTIWCATDGGLCRFDKNALSFDQVTNIGSKRINAITEDEEGSLWLATEKIGIIKFDPSSYETINISTNDGLANQRVHSINYDVNTKKLWIGTDFGVNSLIQRGNDYIWQLFDTHSTELPNDMVKSIFIDTVIINYEDKTSDTLSYLWFGTNAGAAQYLGNAYPPETCILTDDDTTFRTNTPIFKVDGRDNTSSQYEISYSYSVFKIDSINGIKTKRDMLDGWSKFSFDTQLIVYTSLPNGDYEILVRARDIDGNIDPSPDQHTFHIDEYLKDKPISSSGDTIRVFDGDRCIDIYIPPKALTDVINIKIINIDSSEINLSRLQIDSFYFAYNIIGHKNKPESLEQIYLEMLNKKATISIRDPITVNEKNRNKYLALYHLSVGKNDWEALGGTIDFERNTISATFKSFGKYAVVGIHELPPKTEPIVKDFNCKPRVFSSTASGQTDRTHISFTLGAQAAVTIKIYNAAGRLVRNLTNYQILFPGENAIPWDGTNDDGKKCASGLYIVYLLVAGKADIKPITIAIVNQ